jgi:hypothetical protein
VINILLLFGCDPSDAFAGDRMQAVVNDWTTVRGKLVIDRQTGVEYWYIEPKAGEGGSFCLTLLVDQDGKPLIYKGE